MVIVNSSGYKEKMAKILLGVAYPVLTLAIGLGVFIAGYSHLPNRITVHFDITRVPTTSLPTPIFGTLMTTILVMAVLACIKVATSRKSIVNINYRTVAFYGGFFSMVTASLMAGAVEIHSGLGNWYDATGPGWWLLLVAFMGLAGAGGAKWLAVKIHEPLSVVCKQPVKLKIKGS